MKDVKDKIWHEFIDRKFGDEYLCRYISRQQEIRKWFKIITITLSAGGIWTALKNFTIPTVISFFTIGLVQLVTSIEGFIIHSEKQIEDLIKLRLLYYDYWNKLEKLFLDYNSIEPQMASDRFYELRNDAKQIEELDSKLNIKSKKRLMLKAEQANRNYLNNHYHV